mgnify:CR=1 FL=1
MSQAPDSSRYCLVTPCRDEAQYARTTLDSVVQQSLQPALWIIVDDGSTDGTSEILAEYADRHEWITVVTRKDRGERKVGPGVIEAFYAGLDTIDMGEFDFLCKLDLDLDLPARYFEILVERMNANPRIGTASGRPYFMQTGQKVSEKCGAENSVGMTKFYRTLCFQEIGGFVREVMWDGIDGHTCRMRGWIAASFADPQLEFEHLRPMGSSQVSLWTGRKRHGFGQWFMGTSLAYMTASALYRTTRPPFLVGGLAMWIGYMEACLARKPRYEAPGFRPFMRRFQLSCLLRGKQRALDLIHGEQAEIWQRSAGAELERLNQPQGLAS